MDNSINNLIDSALKGDGGKTLLRERFESKLEDVNLSFNQFIESYEMNFRTTNAILDGVFKYIDPVSLLKVAAFLKLSSEDILKECISQMPLDTRLQIEESKKKTFLLENFNLAALKKDGVINTLKDFEHIEKSILRTLGLKNIYDYTETEGITGLFSTVKCVEKDLRPKKMFKAKAIKISECLSNRNHYQVDNLKSFFPNIRAYSTDIESGLLKVIRELYKIGVNVVVHPALSSSRSRGITVQNEGNPTIVLTDYGKKYSTLWFALLHELYHIIFDWSDIIHNRIHVSDDDDKTVDKERLANEFAREYMFPRTRMAAVTNKIHDPIAVKSYAAESNVHPSIIYDNYCYDHPESYSTYSKFVRIPWTKLYSSLIGSISHSNSPEEFCAHYQSRIFNNLI
ncbi:MAG: ImmA/IrrE family metallo-endopeptidase [Sphingobacteriales bacterium]|nr:MAG: ImmA/IrrE family metallo-endopeptidase [Sphingobacteriales bacterium]